MGQIRSISSTHAPTTYPTRCARSRPIRGKVRRGRHQPRRSVERGRLAPVSADRYFAASTQDRRANCDMKATMCTSSRPLSAGAFGSRLRPQYQVVLAVMAARAGALCPSGANAPVDVLARLPARRRIQRIELGANAGVTLDAISTKRSTSQYEDFHRHETEWSGLLQRRQCEVRAERPRTRSCYIVRHARSKRHDRCLCARMREGRTRGRAQDRSAGPALAVLLDLDTEQRRAAVQQNLRECYRQGATQGRQAVQRFCLSETALARLRRELRHSGRGGSGFTPSDRAHAGRAAQWTVNLSHCKSWYIVKLILVKRGKGASHPSVVARADLLRPCDRARR